jgi:hypothetical protein
MASFGPLLTAIRPKILYNFRTTAMFPILHLNKIITARDVSHSVQVSSVSLTHNDFACLLCCYYWMQKIRCKALGKTSNSITAMPYTVKIGLKCLKVKKNTHIHTHTTYGAHKRNFILFSLKSRLKLHVLKLHFSYKNRSHGFWKPLTLRWLMSYIYIYIYIWH